jgi:Protein of unknown function (DUF1176)
MKTILASRLPHVGATTRSGRMAMAGLAFAVMIGPGLATAGAQDLTLPQPIEVDNDWAFGCDNTMRCTIMALVPKSSTADATMWMSVTRDAALDARPVVSMRVYTSLDQRPTRPATLTLDGKRLDEHVLETGGDIVLEGGVSRAEFLNKLLKGKILALTTPEGEERGRVSLDGFSMALSNLDLAQNREGTATAIMFSGDGPRTRLVEVPEAPQIVRAPASTKPARTPDVALIDRERARFGCARETMAISNQWRQTERLDERTTLVTIPDPCPAGRMNVRYHLVLLTDDGEVRRARLDIAPDPSDPEVVFSPIWDRRRRVLSFSRIARAQPSPENSTSIFISMTYVWDGERFRLAERTDMPASRHSFYAIRTWTARVTER